MRKPLMWSLMMFCAVAALGAASINYKDVRLGKLSGKLLVQWLEPDVFLFTPDAERPLTFTRANGSVLKPGRMITDGGSIPRPMRVFRNYSPWGYAPAFIVHDWIFRMNNCKIDDYRRYSLDEAGLVMSEVIKTMMESGAVEKDATTVQLMHTAVTSRFAKQAWDSGMCRPVPSAFTGTPLYEFTIDYK